MEHIQENDNNQPNKRKTILFVGAGLALLVIGIAAGFVSAQIIVPLFVDTKSNSKVTTINPTIDKKIVTEKEIITPSPSPQPTATPTPKKTASIFLSGSVVDQGISLTWEPSNIDTSSGFKVVWSKNTEPSYPSRDGDSYHYFSESTKRNDIITEYENEQTYYFRVCQYSGSKCGIYSNEISLKTPAKKASQESTLKTVKSIGITVSKQDNDAKITWNIDGSSPLGFKVVWSQNTGPTYPTRNGDEYHYLSNPSAREDKITGLESGKTYYFRVCEYLGGKCGVYSNEVSLAY